MGFYRFMGYGCRFGGNQGGGPKNVWVTKVYGFLPVWVFAVSTVDLKSVRRFQDKAVYLWTQPRRGGHLDGR